MRYTLGYIIFFYTLIVRPLPLYARGDLYRDALYNIQGIIDIFTNLAFATAFIAFFWGIARFLFSSSEEQKKNAMRVMAYSIGVMFVMLSVWGVVNLMQDFFAVDSGDVKSVRFPMVVPK